MNDPAIGGSEEVSEEMITTLVAQKVVRLIYSGALKGQEEGTGDPDLAIDGVIMGLAAVLEQAPEFRTNQLLRKASEDFGKRLAHHAKVFRAMYEETGVHPITHLAGGADVRPQAN